VLDHEVLQGLKSFINELIDEVSATEMDEDLASFLIDELLNIRFAIERFDLLGESSFATLSRSCLETWGCSAKR